MGAEARPVSTICLPRPVTAEGAFVRLAGPYLAQPRACCHRMLGPHFAQDTERWISGPARISTSKAADPASQKGTTK